MSFTMSRFREQDDFSSVPGFCCLDNEFVFGGFMLTVYIFLSGALRSACIGKIYSIIHSNLSLLVKNC